MRSMATLTAAASVLAMGMAAGSAAPLLPGQGGGSAEGLVQHVQRGGDDKGPGSQAPGMRGGEGRGDGRAAKGDRDGGRGMRSEKGMRDQGRAAERGRVDIDVDRDRGRRARRGGGFDVYIGPGYGPGCGWLRRRALDTGSNYWWRRYRACIGG